MSDTTLPATPAEATGDAFAAVLALISLATDPAAARKHLMEISSATAKLEHARTALDADAAKHAAAVAVFDAERREVGQLKAELNAANVRIKELGRQLAEKNTQEFLDRHPRPQGRLVPVGGAGSTMTQEVFDDPPPRDAHYDGAN